MRFLEEYELPEWEQKRRKVAIDAIEAYKAEIARCYAIAEPELVRMAVHGEYARERAYRQELYRRTELLRQQIIHLMQWLPPHMMCRKDEILERVAQSYAKGA